MQEIRTGRALKLEGLENAKNKVTLGFKCEAGTKIQLVEEALQSGMTLSEYVDTLISSRHTKVETSSSSFHFQSDLKLKLERAKQEITQYSKALDFYEKNPLLNKLLASSLGHQLQYTDMQGIQRSIRIQSVADVFILLVHSFKIN